MNNASPLHHQLIGELEATRTFFNRSTSELTEDDGSFAPVPGAFTAIHQVAHVAHTVDWFVDGGLLGKGFDMDFAAAEQALRAVPTLASAREWVDRAFDRAVEIVWSMTVEQLNTPLAEGIMGGQPRSSCIGGIVDHTAHHRGALTVYARLRGKTPPMPYM